MSASAPIYTGGWFGVTATDTSNPVTAIYTAGWFLVSPSILRIQPANPLTEAIVEQKIVGQLKRFYLVGTGSNESPGTMGSSGHGSSSQPEI